MEALRPAVAPISLAAAAFPMVPAKSPAPPPAQAHDKADVKHVEIAEVIVGAILGPGGRSLVEIQQISGANIQISKKGTFAPGTRNRIVTISGSQTAITNAHYLIEQKIQEEELKRTRHNTITGLIQ